MTADEIMARIRSLDPREFERLLALMKTYQTEVQAGRNGMAQQANALPPEINEKLARLERLERRERESQSYLE